MNISLFDEATARKNFCAEQARVVGYARLSFDEDGEGYCSIINQKSILDDYRRSHFQDATYDFVADDNITGYKFERPGFEDVLHRIEDGECNVVLAKDLSRIGRHGALTQLFIEQCERVGVRILAIDDYDSEKQSDELILGIRAWTNERLVKDTSAKILKIVRHKQANGTWFCAAPYGYRVLNYAEGKVEIDEDAAAIVRRIAEMYCNGLGVNKIARILTDEHVPTPSAHIRDVTIADGKKCRKHVSDRWTASVISKMLDDEFYIGTLRTGKYKRRGINGADVRTDEKEHHVFPHHHDAILAEDVFARIQTLKEQKKRTNDRGFKKEESIFHGMVQCGDCGRLMYAIQRPGLSRQYVCSTYYKYGKHLCTAHTVKERLLVHIATQYLTYIRDTSADAIAQLEEEVKQKRKKSVVNVDKQRSTLAELQNKLVAIEEQRVNQLMLHPERETAINAIYDKMYDDTQSSIDRIEEENKEQKTAAQDVKSAKTALDIINEVIDNKNITRKDAMALFEKVTVYADGRIDVKTRGDIPHLSPAPFDVEDKAEKQAPREYSVVNDSNNGDPSHTSLNVFVLLEMKKLTSRL